MELDSHSSSNWSDSGVNHYKTEALRPKSLEAKTPSRLAASSITNMMRAAL